MPWEHLDPSRCRLRLPSRSIPASSFVFDTMILTSFNRCFRGFCTFLAHLLRLLLSSKSLVVWRNNSISYIGQFYVTRFCIVESLFCICFLPSPLSTLGGYIIVSTGSITQVPAFYVCIIILLLTIG